MSKYRFTLEPDTLNVFPLPNSSVCFYITGTYRVVSGSNENQGTASFQSWINSTGTGSGMLVVDLLPRRLFFIQILASYTGTFRIDGMGLAGGLSKKCGRQEQIERGYVEFYSTKDGGLDCTATAYFQEPTGAVEIPYYQAFLLTDPVVFTNTIEQGNPSSVYRVGSLKIRDSMSNEEIGDNLFQNYPTKDNRRGIGLSVYTSKSLTFYSMLSLRFSGPIDDPDSTVKVDAIIPAGQKYARNFFQGIDSSIPINENYFETIRGSLLTNPAGSEIELDCFLTNGVFNVFQLQPGEPKSTVRLISLEIVADLEEKKPIGKWIAQTYVTSRNKGIGIAAISLRTNGKAGTLFSLTEVSQIVPTDPARASAHGFTSGNGDFKNLEYGYANLEAIPETSDYKARIVFYLSPRKHTDMFILR